MKKIIIFLFITASLLMIVNIAFACSCAMPKTPNEELEKSTAVFSGKVVDINALAGFLVSSADPVKITFEVSTVWKGSFYKTLIVITERDEVSCGYSFKKDEEYIVYAYGNVTELRTNICWRTKSLSDAQEDLAELGKGKTPDVENPNLPEKSNLTQLLLFVGSIIILLIIVFFIIEKYRK